MSDDKQIEEASTVSVANPYVVYGTIHLPSILVWVRNDVGLQEFTEKILPQLPWSYPKVPLWEQKRSPPLEPKSVTQLEERLRAQRFYLEDARVT